MSPWTRVPAGVQVCCGRCGAALAAGAPVAHLVIAGVRRALVRCTACAGPAPADLPEMPVAAPPPAPRRPLPAWTPVAALAAGEWRARAAGREPGEEG